jgi:hypothetical protein
VYRSGGLYFVPGTILSKLHRGGRLEKVHLRAARYVLVDLERATTGAPPAWASDAFDRITLLLEEALPQKEGQLFVALFIEDYLGQGRGAMSLPKMGELLSGYGGREQAYSAGVARVQALLERIDAYYEGAWLVDSSVP